MVHCLRLQSLYDLIEALWCGSLVSFWMKAVPVGYGSWKEAELVCICRSTDLGEFARVVLPCRYGGSSDVRWNVNGSFIMGGFIEESQSASFSP